MHCVHTIQTEISDVEGVKMVMANANNKSVVISFETPASEQTLKDTLKAINYPVAE
jgi:copper chaperone CopZ